MIRSLRQFFERMNNTDFPYVVLRNFAGFPDNPSEGSHADIDLLVYDIKHWKELYPEAMAEYPLPRVRHKVTIGGTIHYFDVRYVGDGYYPQDFENAILETREFQDGFYTPNAIHFRIALVYHAAHHKNANDYKRYIGDAKIEEYLESLKKSSIGYSTPDDPTVGTFNQYWKGATSVVSVEGDKFLKKQTGWSAYKLIDNEYRILVRVQSKRFPTVEKSGEDILIENCGERLNKENLPADWKEQLIDIVHELKKFGIQHRDIKPDNLMVKDGVIKLIDFGWAKFIGEAEDRPPSCLGYPYRPTDKFDDSFSMRKVIKEFEYKLEEGK